MMIIKKTGARRQEPGANIRPFFIDKEFSSH